MVEAVEAWRANRAALAELIGRSRASSRGASNSSSTRPARSRPLALRPGEADEIRATLAAAQHGEAIARGSAAVHEALTAESGGARDGVALALREARVVARVDPRFEPLAERLAGLEAELTDVAAEARSLAETVDHDPAALAALEERLGAIYGLERRYGDGEAAVIAHGERAAAEAERLRGLDGERARRDADDARLLAEVAVAADAPLRGSPTRPAAAMTAAVGAVLVELGLSRRRLRGRARSAHRRPGRAALSSSTATRSPSMRPASTRSCTDSPRTPGEPPRPLARIASGGELSRVALADQAGPRRGGRDADARVRRGRHGDRRPQRRPGRAQPVDARPPAPGAVRDAPARRSRPMPTPSSGSRSASATAGRSPRSSALDREGRIVELAQMLGSAPAGRDAGRRRPALPRPASCSTAPRPGAARSRRPADRPTDRTADDMGARSTLDAAIDDYLAYLAVERGLAPATIRAYRGDLDGLRGEPRDDGGLGAFAGCGGRLPRCPDPPWPPGDPGLAPTSLRRRAAALKGFYRFAYGEGLIGVDVAAHLDLPRQSRLLPETLTVDETERLLEAAGGDDPDEPDARRPPPRPGAARAALRGGSAGQRGASARRARTSRSTAGSCGSSARATRSGSSRSATSPSTGSGAGSTGREPRLWRSGTSQPTRGGPVFLGDRGRPARPAAGVGGGQGGGRGRRASPSGSARTRCATRSRPTCSRAAPTCGSSRSCSAMRVSPRPSSTRT